MTESEGTLPMTPLSRRTLVGVGAALLASPAIAQGFPQRPIRFLCPFPAGGIVDVVMRAISDDLAADLGQPVVVEVRTGAGGLIASQALAAALPDGHTWMMASLGNIVAPILNPSPGLHPVESVQGLAMVSRSISLLVVRADSPARSVAEFADLARARPGQLNYLRPGIGTFAHMSMEVIQRALGVQLTAVDYRGLPPGIVDLLAGRLDAAVLASGLAMPHIREGRLRAIGAVGTVRLPDLPELPTLGEQGIPAGNLDSWYVAVAPAGLQEPVLARISRAFTTVLSSPAAQDRLRRAGTLPYEQVPPAQVQAFLVEQYRFYAMLIREANITTG
jgi:tripartite-type tricarboxylate transporter receptor subunit TctC